VVICAHDEPGSRNKAATPQTTKLLMLRSIFHSLLKCVERAAHTGTRASWPAQFSLNGGCSPYGPANRPVHQLTPINVLIGENYIVGRSNYQVKRSRLSKEGENGLSSAVRTMRRSCRPVQS